MRKLIVDEAFDGGVFRGALTPSAGTTWVGLRGVLGSLEAALGLNALPQGAGVRVGEALRGLSERSGFWDASLKSDGLATARALLWWADSLRLEGWKGEGGERLGALHAALAEVSPGPAERLAAARTRLNSMPDVRFALESFAPLEQLPRAYREALALATTSQHLRSLPSGAKPEVQLIRPHGPLMAADVVAAALAANPEIPTVIIGSDAILDAALRRYGLPTTGSSETAHDNVLGELLPLVMELVLEPADPNRAFELLSIAQGPISGRLARRLRGALSRWPAVGSPDWIDALNDALSEEEPARAAKLRERVQLVFGGDVRDANAVPAKRLLERASWMHQWVQGRVAKLDEGNQGPWLAVSGQISLFRNLVDRSAVETLSMVQVRRMLEEAHGGMSSQRAFAAEHGLPSVADAGGVVAPIERVVWWNFVRSAAPTPRVPMLTQGEVEALKRAGVVLPTIAELARQRAAAWRRPFASATSALWLISPRHELNGDDAAPHAAWDELAAKLPNRGAGLVRDVPHVPRAPTTRAAELLPIPAPSFNWNADRKLERRETESPSSLELMLGCTLAWSLRYQAKLYGGDSATLAVTEQILGSLAHFVLLERTLRTTHASPEHAADYSIEVFKTEGPRLAALLFMPGADAERAQAEQVLRSASMVLQRLIDDGWSVHATEQSLDGKGFKTGLSGTPDLVLRKGKRFAVIDLKWSSESYRRKVIENGTSLQLATYAELLRQGGAESVSVAYFILTSQALLSTDAALTGGVALESAFTPKQTFALFEDAHAALWKDVAKGRLVAPGVVDEKHVPSTEIDDDGALTVQPGCRFCEFDGVCGRRYGRTGGVDEED